MRAGYSGTPLVRKLGIKRGDVVAILHAPAGYDAVLGELSEDVSVIRKTKGPVDVIQLFARSEADLEREFGEAKSSVKHDGMIWVCWPKKSSRIKTDLSDNVGEGLDSRTAWWTSRSALKFVRRSKDRRGASS
jgi:hypothetical protein